jgi:hypothetical protein
MANITTTEHEGERMLLVRCFEPLTKVFPAEPPYDRQVLRGTVAVCPGAQFRQIGYEYIPFPVDSGDERYDFALAVTEANLLALRATGFEWSPEALAAAARFAFPEDRVRQVRAAALEHVREWQAEVSEWFEKVRNGVVCPPPEGMES